MSVNTFVIAQIKAQVGAIQKKYPQERIIAVQTDEGWKDNLEIISRAELIRFVSAARACKSGNA